MRAKTLLALQPVSFRYKPEFDGDGIPQLGLIAEEVEKVNPDLVARDENGKVCTVRYEAVNAMLLNEFLKEHREVQLMQAAVVQEKNATDGRHAELQKQIELLTAKMEETDLADRESQRAGATEQIFTAGCGE